MQVSLRIFLFFISMSDQDAVPFKAYSNPFIEPFM